MPTTSWTLVRAAGADADSTDRVRALEILARDYWGPIYTYIRAWGRSPEDAEDLTQSFLSAFIERDSFAGISAENGKFRSWLLAALKNFLLADKRDRSRIKRGGGVEHLSIDRDLGEAWLDASRAAGDTPEVIFERRWAAGMLQRAMSRLQESCRREGRERQFEALLPLIAGMDARRSYAEVAAELEINEGAARAAAFRLRKRLRSFVREEVATTVASAAEVDEELAHFFASFQGG